MVDTFITGVSQDTWIFFPWDMALQYVEALSRHGVRGGSGWSRDLPPVVAALLLRLAHAVVTGIELIEVVALLALAISVTCVVPVSSS